MWADGCGVEYTGERNLYAIPVSQQTFGSNDVTFSHNGANEPESKTTC